MCENLEPLGHGMQGTKIRSGPWKENMCVQFPCINSLDKVTNRECQRVVQEKWTILGIGARYSKISPKKETKWTKLAWIVIPQ